LFVLLVFLILLADLLVFELVGGRGQEEGEDSRGLLKKYLYVSLEVIDGELLAFLLRLR
jgi:hypothetical protein